MKDLFVFTADTDALAVVRTVLGRPEALRIRPITFDVDRHTGRDPGMVKDGPELVRMSVQKTAFQKVILIWDHQGSGWEAQSPEEARVKIQLRLDGVTWKHRSEAVVVMPELEEWVWHHPASIAQHLGMDLPSLELCVGSYAQARNTESATCKNFYPKELFEYALHKKYRRKPLPQDFKSISALASLVDWQRSDSFRLLVKVLRAWFPR